MAELEAFFHDLRALRVSAGLSLAELAGRTHFPRETLAAAEAGPAVPPNPVLVAYVQACGGPVGQWEDRWRDACAAAADRFPVEVPGPSSIPPAPPGGRPGRRVAAAAAVAALVAAGTAVALTRPAAHTAAAASAKPRTSPVVSRHGTSRPRPLPRHAVPAVSTPRMTPVVQIAGVGCPAGQGNGITFTAAKPGPPWTAAQGGWADNGCDGASVWTVNPAGKQAAPSALTWSFGALSGVSRCTLSVYVPTQNAFGRASYTITAGTGASLGTVIIDQAAEAGYWVVLGTFPAASSGFQIQLTPEVTELTAAGPAAQGPGMPPARPARPAPPGRNSAIAASAAATSCSGSPG
jgi:Helix-turn-helix domain